MSSDKNGGTSSVAAWLIALRSGVSQSWRSAVVLALMFGVTAGLAVAALTTANRVESSYDNLLVELDAPDLLVDCFHCQGPDDFAKFTQSLLADPAVSDISVLQQVHPILRTATGVLLGPFENECDTGSGELSATSPSWVRSDAPPVRVTAGRLPAPGAANEIALPAVTAQRAGVEVGDQLSVSGLCYSDNTNFQAQTLSVVGIFVGFIDVRPPGQAEYFELVLVDPAFASTIGAEPHPGGTLVWYQPGSDLNDLGGVARESIFVDMKEHARLIEDRLRPDATALRILAVIGAVAAIAVLGQLLARHLRLVGNGYSALRALGVTRRELWCLGVGHGVSIGIVAGTISAGAALGFLPFVPPGAAEGILIGTTRPIPLAAIALGVAITGCVVVLLSVIPSWMIARASARRATLDHQTVASRLVGDGRLGTTPSWGVRLALETSSGKQPVPVRSGLGAAVIAAAVVASVLTFAASLDHLRATPRLVGWNWDFVAGGDDVDVQALANFVAGHPDVARSSVGTIFPHGISLGATYDLVVNDFAFETGQNAVTPTVVDGRAPQGADEIVLDTQLADRLGVKIGDEVTLLADDNFVLLHDLLGVATELPARKETSFELVGLGVLPMFDGRFDRGVSLTMDGVRRILAPTPHDDLIGLLLSADPVRLRDVLVDFDLTQLATEVEAALPNDTSDVIRGWKDEQLTPLNSTVEPQAVFVKLFDSADRAAVAADFANSGLIDERSIVIGMLPDGTAVPTTKLVAVDLDDVAWIPTGMGILMGLTTLAVLAHLIATGARARRRDIATLRALGLVGAQVRGIVAWQALTLVAVTAAFALPIGVFAGRYAWRIYAKGLGVVPEPVTPWAGLAALLAALVVAHLLASVLPGRSAARMRFVDSLRSE